MSINSTSKRSIFRHLKNKWVIGSLIIIVVIIIYMLNRGGSASTIESTKVSLGNVTEIVSVTGKISAIDKADLAFEKSGTISYLGVKVGDHIKRGALIASLNNTDTEASLASAQAKLADLTRPLSPEELKVQKTMVDSAQIALDNARINATNASRDGYVKAQGAIFSYVDSFFTNPQSANPTIKIVTQSNTQQTSIQQSRILVTDTLNKWNDDLNNTDAQKVLSSSRSSLNIIKSFMDSLSSIVNYLNPGNSGLSQNQIDAYVSSMNMALAGLNQAITAVASADTSLQQAQASLDEAQSSFALKNAGSSSDAIRAQQATVDSLAATVSKGRIVSPIDGLITKADPEKGEFVSAGQTVFTVMSEGVYKIEAFVPEADIAKVSLGNHAKVTLDAYGSNTFFDATVTAVDPAETIIEGVATYKVTLMFDHEDSRIRSGMTANTDILTHEKDNVLIVPTRAIIDSDTVGMKAVRILNADGKTFNTINVDVGLKGSDGFTEILSGLSEGQVVVTYVK